MAQAIVDHRNYVVAVYKNPKVGHKPPRLVPFLTNCSYGEEVPKDRRGNPLPPVVARYREFSRAVDGANQMALQIRQLGRQMTWSHAVRAFMVWCAAGKAFAIAKALGLVDEKTTMWEFQWDILKQRRFSGAEFNNTTPAVAVPTVHALKRFVSRLGTHCRSGSTRLGCGACGKHMHIKCFGDAHTVVCHGRGGADRDRQGGGCLCHPYPWDQCEPWWNNRVGWIPNCEYAPPPTVVLCDTTRRACHTRCTRIACVDLNVSPEAPALFCAFRTFCAL